MSELHIMSLHLLLLLLLLLMMSPFAEHLYDFEIRVGANVPMGQNNFANTLCASQKAPLPGGPTVLQCFAGRPTGRYLTIQMLSKGFLHVCEVQVAYED
jgi:hypothetical protein